MIVAFLLCLLCVVAGVVPGLAFAQDCRGIWSKMCAGGPRGGPVPLPPPPSQHLTRFHELLAQLRQYSSKVDAYSWAADSDERVFQHAAQLYDLLYPELRLAVNTSEMYRRQIDFFAVETPKIRPEIQTRQNDVARLRQAIPVLEQQISATEAARSRVEAHTAQITSVALGIMNNRRTLDAIYSHLLVFAPRPGIQRDSLTQHDRVDRLSGIESMPRQPAPQAFAALGPPTTPWPASGDNRELSAYADVLRLPTVPERLTALSALNDGFRGAHATLQERRPRAESMRADYEPLWRQQNDLLSETSRLWPREQELKQSADWLKESLAVANRNGTTTARALVTELVVDHAQSIMKEKLVQKIEALVKVSGLRDVPLGRDDAIRQLAQAGKTIVLPHDRFRRQWEAFLDAQKQTLDLVHRNGDYMHEAARLAATGSPREMDAYLDRIFKDVKWQSVEYLKIAGTSDLRDEDRNFFTNALDKYLSIRKSRDGVD